MDESIVFKLSWPFVDIHQFVEELGKLFSADMTLVGEDINVLTYKRQSSRMQTMIMRRMDHIIHISKLNSIADVEEKVQLLMVNRTLITQMTDVGFINANTTVVQVKGQRSVASGKLG